MLMKLTLKLMSEQIRPKSLSTKFVIGRRRSHRQILAKMNLSEDRTHQHRQRQQRLLQQKRLLRHWLAGNCHSGIVGDPGKISVMTAEERFWDAAKVRKKSGESVTPTVCRSGVRPTYPVRRMSKTVLVRRSTRKKTIRQPIFFERFDWNGLGP
jgi:hypothetical protein